MIIKASGIDNLTVARYFSAFDATYFGFKALDPNFVAEVCSWLFEPAVVIELPLTTEAAQVSNYQAVLPNVVFELSYSNAFSQIDLFKSIPHALKIEQIEDVADISQDWKPKYIAVNKLSSPEVNHLRHSFSCPILLTLSPGTEDITKIIEAAEFDGYNIIGQSETETGLLDFEATDKIMQLLVPED